jgi:hypothetical protein
MLWLLRVEEIYSQLIEHLSDRLTNPVEAINKATQLLAKYYLNIEEEQEEPDSTLIRQQKNNPHQNQNL